MDKFERNRVGRLVSNIVPKFTAERLEAAFPEDFEAQTVFLKEVLHVLGGPQYREGLFEIDGCEEQFPGVTTGQTWNGWACPLFTKEVGLKICDSNIGSWDDNRKAYYQPEADVFCFPADDGEWTEYAADEHGYYAIGTGEWVWDEVRPEPVDE